MIVPRLECGDDAEQRRPRLIQKTKATSAIDIETGSVCLIRSVTVEVRSRE